MIENSIILKDFQFEAGGRLDEVKVVFHTSMEKYIPGTKVVWVCHALTANSDATDWWPQLVGPGLLIDTDRYFVVCVNTLCSPYGSSGPASTDPKTGKPYFFNFPATTIRDMMNATIAVRKHLGIGKIDLMLGSSIGGFQAIEWAVMEPGIFRRQLFMATSARVSPWHSAENAAQRMALEADASFREAKDLKGGSEGLKCARAQALLTYRCHRGYCLTQAEQDPDTLFAGRAASYEQYQGEKLVRRNFDAYSYKYLLDSLDSHNVGRGRGGVEAALGTIRGKCKVVSIDTDGIFPPVEMQTWAKQIPGAEYHVIHSDFGHDGFLLETEQLTPIIKELLD